MSDDEDNFILETDSEEYSNELIDKYKLYNLKPSFSNVQKIYDEFRYEGYGEVTSIECEERLMKELKLWTREYKDIILELININKYNTKMKIIYYFDNNFRNINEEFNKSLEQYINEHNIERNNRTDKEIMEELI